MSLQSRIEEAKAKYHWYTVVFLEETSQEELVNSGLKISHGDGNFTDRVWVSGFEVPERFNHVEIFGLDLSNLCNNNLNKIALISAECLSVFNHVISKQGRVYLNMLEAFGKNKFDLNVFEQFADKQTKEDAIITCIEMIIHTCVRQVASKEREALNKSGVEKVLEKHFPNQTLTLNWR